MYYKLDTWTQKKEYALVYKLKNPSAFSLLELRTLKEILDITAADMGVSA